MPEPSVAKHKSANEPISALLGLIPSLISTSPYGKKRGSIWQRRSERRAVWKRASLCTMSPR